LTDSIPGRIAIAVAASLFIAACAHVSIPLPFTPVPLTLQNFAVLLVGLLLGPSAGFAAVALYVAEGALGMPVFTPHGPVGIARVLGPNGGYILAFPFAAATAGWAFRSLRLSSAYARAAIGGVIATVIILSTGFLWLGHVLHFSASTVWMMAVAPFLPGEVVKIIAAAGLATSITRLRRA
jgi:biotin transport system substrate-specific component